MSHQAEQLLNQAIPWVCTAAPVTVMLLLLVLPLINSMLMEKRINRHRCLRCGYDLRKLPPGTRSCPECGRNLGRTL